jgi:hypothetical protein
MATAGDAGRVKTERLDWAEARRRLALAQIRQYPDPSCGEAKDVGVRRRAGQADRADQHLLKDANGVGWPTDRRSPAGFIFQPILTRGAGADQPLTWPRAPTSVSPTTRAACR